MHIQHWSFWTKTVTMHPTYRFENRKQNKLAAFPPIGLLSSYLLFTV